MRKASDVLQDLAYSQTGVKTQGLLRTGALAAVQPSKVVAASAPHTCHPRVRANYCLFAQARQVHSWQFDVHAVGFKWENPMPAAPLTPLSARTFNCGWCQTQARVCTSCDRGQRYCCANCRTQARQACQCRASACYQSSRVGSINHARRQRRYRQREQQQPEPEQIVTHQGSQAAFAGDLLMPEMELDVIKDQADAAASLRHCHWCGRAISNVRRMGWLRHAVQDEPNHRLNGEPRGQSP